MNSKHYRSNPKSKQFKRQKVFKGVKGPPITWEFVEKEKEPVPLTTWQKVCMVQGITDMEYKIK